MIARSLFTSSSVHWSTPPEMYQALDREFSFTLDPCPLGLVQPSPVPLLEPDGLNRSWRGERVYCNPPYGPGIGFWLNKGLEAAVAVYLLPARTDTAWFHEWVIPRASEVRFLRGRLHFGGARAPAPFPSMLAIFGGEAHA